jgi:hypothetical protein
MSGRKSASLGYVYRLLRPRYLAWKRSYAAKPVMAGYARRYAGLRTGTKLLTWFDCETCVLGASRLLHKEFSHATELVTSVMPTVCNMNAILRSSRVTMATELLGVGAGASFLHGKFGSTSAHSSPHSSTVTFTCSFKDTPDLLSTAGLIGFHPNTKLRLDADNCPGKPNIIAEPNPSGCPLAPSLSFELAPCHDHT